MRATPNVYGPVKYVSEMAEPGEKQTKNLQNERMTGCAWRAPGVIQPAFLLLLLPTGQAMDREVNLTKERERKLHLPRCEGLDSDPCGPLCGPFRLCKHSRDREGTSVPYYPVTALYTLLSLLQDRENENG